MRKYVISDCTKAEVLQALHQIDFQVKTKCSYGEFNIPPNYTVFIAIK